MKVNIICDHGDAVARTPPAGGRGRVLRLSTDPRYGNVYFAPEAVSSGLGHELDPVSQDLCEIAAYVFMADKSLPRGYDGAWTRDMSFLVPVRDPDLWESVKKPLVNAVSYLSGDNVQFNFIRKPADQRPAHPERPAPGASDCVCLFSGGLDSLAGAVHLIGQGRTPLFASHYISVLKSLQSDLLTSLREEFGRDFEHFQYRVTSRKTKDTKFPIKAVESSHRARSFMFLSFAAAAAAVRGLQEIYICENGVMSLNVPISDARKGSRSTRHAHPLFLHYFNQLIDSLYERPFNVRNPFQFWTKGEEARLLRDTNLCGVIKDTVTCWGYPNQTLRYKHSNHCGYCLPCIVRRVSLISAGLSQYDDHYAFDVFNMNGSSKEKHVRNIDDLIYFCRTFTNLSNTELLYRYPELMLVGSGTNGAGDDKVGDIISVYKKFSHEVLTVVGNGHARPTPHHSASV
jgi:7-cyano-7-deazaguanine synthase in queuosine biosynthesis